MEPRATSEVEGRTPAPLVLREGLSVLPLSTVVTEHAAAARPEHTVLVNTGAPYRLVETLDGPPQRTRGLPGDVAVVPAGAELAVRSADGAPQAVESLVVSLSGALLDEVLDAAGAHPDRHTLLPAVGSCSPRVAQLAGLVRSGLADRTDLGRLALGALGHALVVAVVRDHVVQQSPALPWGGTFEGHDGLGRFLTALTGRLDSTPETERIYGDGAGRVVQVGRTRGTVRATGAAFDVAETHVWTVRDGQVVRFEAYVDAQAMLAALAAQSSAVAEAAGA